MYYSKSTGGFYDEAIHGARKTNVIVDGWVHPSIEVPDPDWLRPQIYVQDPEWVAADHPEGTDAPTVLMPDTAAIAPMITILDPAAVPDTVAIDNPDCKIPADAMEITVEDHAALLAAQSEGKIIQADIDGKPIAAEPPPPTPEQIEKALGDAVQAHLDAAAQARGYDNIFTAVTYADEPAVAKFQDDGKVLRAWRSNVWDKCYQVLAAVQSGKQPTPTAEELLASLPPAP